jgi:pSer/pThr/pTyr-binding forkhead associated (FHA) protein
MAAQAGAAQDTSGFFVTITTPKGSTTKKIEGDTLSVGRSEDCDLSIPHETLSRRHMTVLLIKEQCWVEDHGSSNGTFVNGKRLKPHSQIRVLPEDYIQLGQSGVRLSVSIAPQMWKETAPPIPNEEEKEAANTIVTTTMTERRAMRESMPVPLPKQNDEAHEQAEKLVQEAQKKAALMVQEAEIEAERRVQDIYRRAHEIQSKSDEIYQKRMNEAYRSAEAVYQKSQAESETILDQARNKSAEIRAQAEGFVMELRRRTEEDCERILDEAQVTARELKEHCLAEGEEMIRRKEEELLAQTRDAMNTRLARFEEDLLKEAARSRELLESELNDRRLQLEIEQKEQIESVKALKGEVSQLMESRDREKADLNAVEAKLEAKNAQIEKIKAEIEAGQKVMNEFNEQSAKLKAEIDQLARIREEAKVATEKVRKAQDSADADLLKLRAKLEEDKSKIEREENRRLEEMKLETARRVKKLEDQLIEELQNKKDRLGRELALLTETFLKENPYAQGKALKPLQDKMSVLLDSQLATLSKDPGAAQKQKSLIELKAQEKKKSMMTGLILGMAVMFGGQSIYREVRNESASPMQRKVAAAAEERMKDLEARKFNPEQTKELRATYTDSVLYTEGFVKKYLNEEFQRKLLAASTNFLLKTWRLDEDKVIQLLAASNALVKSLNERREAIHPDFIPQGIEKMKDLENEAAGRMRKLLGSQVRYESFRKFERKFYEQNAD